MDLVKKLYQKHTQSSKMKKDGVEIRKLETIAQFVWFHNFKCKLDRADVLSGYAVELDDRLCSEKALLFSLHGWELIEADGQIWPVRPDDHFKEIFGLNPVKSGTTHQHLAQEEGEGSNKVPEHDTEPRYYESGNGGVFCIGETSDSSTKNMNYGRGEVRGHPDHNHIRKEAEMFNKLCEQVGDGGFFCIGETSGLSTKNMNCVHGQVGGRPDRFPTHKEEGEGSNKVPEHDTEPRYYESGNGGVFCIGETSDSSTKNMNYGCGEVRGHPDHNHIRKNHFAFDDEGNYEGLTEAMQKSISEASEAIQKSFEAAMKRGIDKKKANDQHVLDILESPDRSDELYKLCEIALPNTVSVQGSNPPPWAATLASQGLSVFSSAANVVGYAVTTAALSLRYTNPRAARIFATIGSISGAWGVIMGFTSYLPGEFQWLGYVAAVFCTLMVLLANC